MTDQPLTGRALSLKAHQEMLGGVPKLPAPPAEFNPESRYLISVSRAVEVVPGDSSHMLRPDQRIEVSGAFAQSISADIVGAKEL